MSASFAHDLAVCPTNHTVTARVPQLCDSPVSRQMSMSAMEVVAEERMDAAPEEKVRETSLSIQPPQSHELKLPRAGDNCSE